MPLLLKKLIKIIIKKTSKTFIEYNIFFIKTSPKLIYKGKIKVISFKNKII